MRAHLIADVPVGLFLSSGLDSGAIAALAARAQAGIRSFTLSFPGTAYDEAPLARKVAERCGTQHTEVPLDGAAMLARIDEAVAALDQPTMDGINTYFVSWAAREVGLKVALSGLGGDELFAGYASFANTALLAAAHSAGMVCAAAAAASHGAFARAALSGRACHAMQRAKPLPRGPIRIALPHPYFFARALFPPGQLERLIEPRFRPSTVGADGVTLEPTWLGWLERTASEAAKLRASGGNRLAGDALLHGQHVAARYRFGEHGAFTGSARAAAGYAAGGIC